MTDKRDNERDNERDENKEKPWTFYVIWHEATGATYAGVSPDVHRRLRQHNGELAGGAKYTTSKGPGGWTHVCFVHGFQTKQQVLQFEWAVKHQPPRGKGGGGLAMRLKKLVATLNKPRWTSNAPPAAEVPLRVEPLLPITLPYNVSNSLALTPDMLPKYVTII